MSRQDCEHILNKTDGIMATLSTYQNYNNMHISSSIIIEEIHYHCQIRHISVHT